MDKGIHMLLGFLFTDEFFEHLLKKYLFTGISLASVSHAFGPKCKAFATYLLRVWKCLTFTKRVRQSVRNRLASKRVRQSVRNRSAKCSNPFGFQTRSTKCSKPFGKAFVKCSKSVRKVFASRWQNVRVSLKVFGKRSENVGAFGVC